MVNSKIVSKRKRRYSKISTQKRQKLINLVLERGQTLTKVAKQLNIKRPTAKVILKRYKQNGTVFNKKMLPIKTKDTIHENYNQPQEPGVADNISIENVPLEIASPSYNGANLNGNINIESQSSEQLGCLFYVWPVQQYRPFI